MKTTFYEALSAPFAGHPRRLTALRWCNRLLTGGISLMYICIIVLLTVKYKWWDLLLSTAIPAVGLAGVSVWRRLVDAPRPYEVRGIPCLLGKESAGRSFPSRHVFSAAVIAVTAWRLSPPLGAAALVATALLALIRMAGGAHFVRDVAVGAATGVLWGSFWFFVGNLCI